MDHFEDTLEHGSEEELNKLKSWLFKENIRIVSASKELEEMQEQFEKEKVQFQKEMKSLNGKMNYERQRLKDDSALFAKKMEILQNGFQQLDMDRRRLDKEWAKLDARREMLSEPVYTSHMDVSVLFKGVKTPVALKKRYKDLIKIFHPDNVAGDKELIQMINKEYENLKMGFETGKQA